MNVALCQRAFAHGSHYISFTDTAPAYLRQAHTVTKQLINLNTSAVDHPGAWPTRCQGRSRAALWGVLSRQMLGVGMPNHYQNTIACSQSLMAHRQWLSANTPSTREENSMPPKQKGHIRKQKLFSRLMTKIPIQMEGEWNLRCDCP